MTTLYLHEQTSPTLDRNIDLIPPNKLVAHRGDPFRFPENTGAGVNSAFKAGAVWGEIDIQYTADFTPVLFHDPDLKRSSRDPREIVATKWKDIKRLPASYSERFGTKFDTYRITRFTELLDSLSEWPEIRIFVELKSTSIDHFGVGKVVDDILTKINDTNCLNQIAAIISKHDVALEAVRAHSDFPIGWVVPDFDDANRARAQQLSLDYLFINKKRFNVWQQGLPRQSERRVVYTVNDLEAAQDLLSLGADMIETDLIGKLIGNVN